MGRKTAPPAAPAPALPFDPRDLVEYTSPAEIENLPGFRARVDSAAVRPIRPIGYYNFPTEESCGLCGEGHKHGITTENSDGSITRVGRKCARDWFGEIFEHLWNTIRSEVARRNAVRDFQAFQLEIPAHIRRVDELWNQPFGGDWQARFRDEFRRFAPGELLAWLGRVASGATPDIYESVPLTDAEKKLRAASGTSMTRSGGGRDDFKSVFRGRVRGRDAWKTSVGTLLQSALRNRLNEYSACNPATMSKKEIKTALEFADSIKSEFALAERLIDAGRAFFQRENLALLAFVEMRDESRRSYLQITWDCENGIAVVRRAA
jgi:hypothetical protein